MATLAIAGAAVIALFAAATTGAQASTSSLTPEELQQCETDALAAPTVLNPPGIYRAGIRTKQSLVGEFEYGPLPDYCAPDNLRVSSGQLETDKGGHWVKTSPAWAVGAIGNQDQRSQLGYTPTHPKPAYVYDECVGGKFQRSRLVLTNTLRAGENGHRTILASQQYILPVPVHGNCQAAVRSRQYYRTHSY